MVEVDPLKALSIITALIVLVGFITYRIGVNRTKESLTKEFQNQLDIEKNRHISEINTLKERHIEELLKREQEIKEAFWGIPIPLKEINFRFPQNTFTVVNNDNEKVYLIRLDKKRTLFCVSSPVLLKENRSYNVTVEETVTVSETK